MVTSDKDIHMNTTSIYIDKFGTKIYYNPKCQAHREDGPAIECANGDKHWYKEGKKHREGGPAIDYADGDKVWYKEGLLHRLDGPAIEWVEGDKSWYILEKSLKEKEFNSWMNRIQRYI